MADSSLLDFALRYAARGWRVLPLHTPTADAERPCTCMRVNCDKPGKHPRIMDWPNNATTDEATIRRWWGMWPKANLGIACGERSGIWVMDADGEEGRQELRRLREVHHEEGVTAHSITPRGDHFIYRYAPGLKNEVRFAPGLDLRTDGGLIVAPPSVHFTGAFYEWDAAADPLDLPPQPAPDWLLDLIRSSGGKPSTNGKTPHVGENLPIPSGQRNQTLWSNGCAMRRRGMTQTEIEAALLIANRDRCSPALEEDVVKDIAARASRYAPAPVEEASVVSVVSEKDENPTSVVSVVTQNLVKRPKMPDALEPEAYHGLPGRVMRTIAPHTEGHPAGILASFLTAGGCLIGPRPHVMRDAQAHACNEFGLLVGPTASGKGTSSRRVDEIFKYSGCLESIINDGNDESGCIGGRDGDLAPDLGFKDLILRGLGSGEALVRGLSEEQDDDAADSRRLVFESEFARCLKVMQREGSTLSDVLKNAWDSEPMHSRTKGETIKADNAHVAILAHVTEKDLRARLSDTDLFNGFANRFLWFSVTRVGLLPFGGGKPPLAPIVSAVHGALSHARSWLGQMEFDTDSKQIWDNHGVYARLRKGAPGLLGPLTDRAPSHVTRIALQYAVWDRSPEIRVPHLLAGLAVWDYSFRTLEAIFGRSTGDPNADLIIENLVEREGGFLTRAEVRDLFARNAKPGEIPAALDLLTEMEIIRREKHQTGGRAAEIIVLTQQNPYDQNDERPLNVARKAAEGLGYTTETTKG